MADESNLILGSFVFGFNATKPSTGANLPASYSVPFGELLEGSLKTSGDAKQMFDSVGGVLYLLKEIKTKRQVVIEAMIKKLDPSALALYMGSASGSAPTPGLITEGFGYLGITAEDEPIVTASGATNKGAAIFAWYGFACGIYLDGELKANAEDFCGLKLNIACYLARDPGLWSAASRPVLAAM